MQKFFPVMLLLVFAAGTIQEASARRRRGPRVAKREPVYTISGRVQATVDLKTRTALTRARAQLQRFQRKAYWRFYDPLTIIRRTIPLSDRLVVVVSGVKQAPEKAAEAEEVRVKAGGIFPTLIVQHMNTDLTVYNAFSKKVSIFSPDRKVEGKLLKPEVISPASETVFNVSPRQSETADAKVHFWSYPLRLKEFATAKARIIFVRSRFYSRVSENGVYTIDELPAGKYTMHFIYVDRIVKEVPITVLKKRGRGRYSRLQYMKPVQLSLPVLAAY